VGPGVVGVGANPLACWKSTSATNLPTPVCELVCIPAHIRVERSVQFRQWTTISIITISLFFFSKRQITITASKRC
jgi:hypothetical protein